MKRKPETKNVYEHTTDIQKSTIVQVLEAREPHSGSGTCQVDVRGVRLERHVPGPLHQHSIPFFQMTEFHIIESRKKKHGRLHVSAPVVSPFLLALSKWIIADGTRC